MPGAPNYSIMTLADLKKATKNLDMNIFDRNNFLHGRAGRKYAKIPMSAEEKRRRNCQDTANYVQRNHNEKAAFEGFLVETSAIKDRLEQLDQLNQEVIPENVEEFVKKAVAVMEAILQKSPGIEVDVRLQFEIQDDHHIYENFKDKHQEAMKYKSWKHQLDIVIAQQTLDALLATEGRSSKSGIWDRIARQQLKRDCYRNLEKIETLIGKMDLLQDCVAQLKHSIWSNTLEIYTIFFKLFCRTAEPADTELVDRIVEHFSQNFTQPEHLSELPTLSNVTAHDDSGYGDLSTSGSRLESPELAAKVVKKKW